MAAASPNADTARALTAGEASALLRVTRILAASPDLEHVLREVIAAAQHALQAERGSVWLLDEAGEELSLHVGTGLASVRQGVRGGIAGACASGRAIVNVPDCYADARFNRTHDEASGYRTRNLLAVPLVGNGDALVGVLQVLNKHEGSFDAADEGLAVALAAQCAVAIQRARMTAALVKSEQYRRELEVARDMQQSTFPARMPSLPGYDLHGFCQPASHAGGDTFDVSVVDGRLVMMLADATGHGVGPALTAARLQAMLQTALGLGAGLEGSLTRANQLLADSLEEDRFITAFLGELDPAAHRLRFHSAGQAPILVYRAASDAWERLGPTTIPLAAMPVLRLRPTVEIDLEPGDMVALVSDGVFDQRGQDGAFGEARVLERLSSCSGGSAKLALEAVMADLEQFAGDLPQDDDVTMVLLKREGGAVVSGRFARSFDSLDAVFALNARFCAGHGVGEGDRGAIDLILEELFTNMVKYNAAGSAEIRVELALHGGCLQGTLSEWDVPAFDVTQTPTPDITAPLSERQPGGLGLHLVRKLSESVRYRYFQRERLSQVVFRRRLGA